jgi:hypothetical protein
MNAVDRLKSLLAQPPPAMPDPGEFIYVYLPQDIEPDERYERYQEPLDAELRLHGAGWVSGGGSLLSDELEDGSRECIHVGVDVDAVDVPRAREILRTQLPSLGAPPGTRLLYRDGEAALEDWFDGETWTLALEQEEDD